MNNFISVKSQQIYQNVAHFPFQILHTNMDSKIMYKNYKNSTVSLYPVYAKSLKMKFYLH